MNLNVHYHLSHEDDPRISCERRGTPAIGYPALHVGEVTIFPTLDQLEELHGVIGQYLHDHAPAPTAKACESHHILKAEDMVTAAGRPTMACPSCGEAMVRVEVQSNIRGAHFRCFQCGNVEDIPDAAPVAAEAATASEEFDDMLARGRARVDESYRKANERRDAARAAKAEARASVKVADACEWCEGSGKSIRFGHDSSGAVVVTSRPPCAMCGGTGKATEAATASEERQPLPEGATSDEIADEMLELARDFMESMATTYEVRHDLEMSDAGYGCSTDELHAAAKRQTPGGAL